MTIDSCRYVDFATRQIIRPWVDREPTLPSPWTPLARPLEQATVALVSTAGMARKDLDVVLPLRRLDELVAAGMVGASATTHQSLMGYILDPTELLRETTPKLVAVLKAEGVEAVVLVPA